MFLGWIYEYVFAVILSALLLIYNIYCFIGLLKFKKAVKNSSDVSSIQTKFNIYAWFIKRHSGSGSSNKKKAKRLTGIVRKINMMVSGICAGALITNIVMLSIIYLLNIQATNISNLLSILFNEEDCCCYAKCTGNEEDDSKTAYELLFGEEEYKKFYNSIVVHPSEKQPFLNMHKNNPNGKDEGEWLINHLDDNALQCYKAIVGNNNKFRSGDHQDRSKMTNEELRQDLIALLKDYKVDGINPNCDRCFGKTERQLSKKCLGEAHWVEGWTWEAIWDSDDPGDGPGDGDDNGGGGGGGSSAQNSQYGVQLSDGWWYWYHQRSTCTVNGKHCPNDAKHSDYGYYGSCMLISGNAASRGCGTYATAMVLSYQLGEEITPWNVLTDVLAYDIGVVNGAYGITNGSTTGRGLNYHQKPPVIDAGTLANTIKTLYGSKGIETNTVKYTDKAAVDAVLDKGGCLILSIGKGCSWYNGDGHFIALRSRDANGLYYHLNSSDDHSYGLMKTGLTWEQLMGALSPRADRSMVGVWNTNGAGGAKPQPGDGEDNSGGGGDYASQIINKMRAAGYNDYSIAGSLGSFVAESGLDPKKTQGNACNGASNAEVRAWQGGKSGRAIGFAQWDGSRAISLLNAADAAGVNWYDFNFQLNFFMAELGSHEYGVASANSNCTDVEHAAWYFTKVFEKCGTCKYAPCGGTYNGQHGVGDNAYKVSFENRNHMNGFNTRSSAAQNFYTSRLGK